ncbi:hypothetical protein KSP40_PGU016155 [Platanthera guangdongensis]|uniref:Uncharacterized protein n=1 Tax=Platanthera guangdongensis TaxID=2320717 RepID=A0ABR2MYB8_9ASPA
MAGFRSSELEFYCVNFGDLLLGCGGNVGLVFTQALSVSSIQHSRNYEKSPLAPDATLVFSGRPLTTRRSNRFRREGPAAPHSLQETQNAQYPDRRRCLDVLCCSLRKRMDEWKPAGGFFQGLPKDGISAKCFGPEVDPVVLSARLQVSRPESRLTHKILSFRQSKFLSLFKLPLYLIVMPKPMAHAAQPFQDEQLADWTPMVKDGVPRLALIARPSLDFRSPSPIDGSRRPLDHFPLPVSIRRSPSVVASTVAAERCRLTGCDFRHPSGGTTLLHMVNEEIMCLISSRLKFKVFYNLFSIESQIKEHPLEGNLALWELKNSYLLTQEKNELREEKAALKSEIDSLNVQYQPRLGCLYPWATVDPSVVMQPPSPYPFPIPVPVPSGSMPFHPPIPLYPFFQNQSPVAALGHCSSYHPYSLSNPLTEQQPTQSLPPHPHPSNNNNNHTAFKHESQSCPADQRGSGLERSSAEFNDVVTELELKIPGSASPSNSKTTTNEQNSPSEGRRGCRSRKLQCKGTENPDASSSSWCSSPPEMPASSSPSNDGDSVGNGG